MSEFKKNSQESLDKEETPIPLKDVKKYSTLLNKPEEDKLIEQFSKNQGIKIFEASDIQIMGPNAIGGLAINHFSKGLTSRVLVHLLDIFPDKNVSASDSLMSLDTWKNVNSSLF
jgi:hypothetical protein